MSRAAAKRWRRWCCTGLDSDVGLWVRPYAMFFEHVDVDGVLQPRFAPVV